MRRFLFLSLLLLSGCSVKTAQKETSDINAETPLVHSAALVVIEARILSSPGCDKYCLYSVELIKILKNSTGLKLDSPLSVWRRSFESQPELNIIYIMYLDCYNDAHPEYGFKILAFTEK
jgi:hypothetical protein